MFARYVNIGPEAQTDRFASGGEVMTVAGIKVNKDWERKMAQPVKVPANATAKQKMEAFVKDKKRRGLLK